MANNNLTNAKNAKNDEFYTQWADIEKEVNAYLVLDPDVFKGKTILCPCDNPFESHFFKYFAFNFNDFQLKKLMATCYVRSPIANSQLALFDDENKESPFDDENKANQTTRCPHKMEIMEIQFRSHDLLCLQNRTW